jgi:hypothetical protein
MIVEGHKRKTNEDRASVTRVVKVKARTHPEFALRFTCVSFEHKDEAGRKERSR